MATDKKPINLNASRDSPQSYEAKGNRSPSRFGDPKSVELTGSCWILTRSSRRKLNKTATAHQTKKWFFNKIWLAFDILNGFDAKNGRKFQFITTNATRSTSKQSESAFCGIYACGIIGCDCDHRGSLHDADASCQQEYRCCAVNEVCGKSQADLHSLPAVVSR